MTATARLALHAEAYPASPVQRDRWVLARRGAKAPLDPSRACDVLFEEEPDAAGRQQPTGVIFLSNRECPFRCVMCDLWIHTLDEPVPAGSIPGQIREAFAGLPPVRQVKLYNAGSFFDPQAIPPEDDEAIAALVGEMDRVIVEAHPAFLRGAAGERCVRFSRAIRGRLEVAIGLETAHPEVLERLNKRMTLDAFEQAAAFLARHGIDLRVFILLDPPFMPIAEREVWVRRSIDLARRCGATACSVIPTRGGNGALEDLGSAWPPASAAHCFSGVLPALERALEYGLRHGEPRVSRVFADLWDADRFVECDCSRPRVERLRAMNHGQRIPAPIVCGACGEAHA